jgi:hypothetical protein
MKKNINGIEIELTQEEILLKQQQDAEFNAGAFDRALKQLRDIRNKLLVDTDYTILQDSTLTPTKKSEFMNYRTALRDLTEGLTTVEQINNILINKLFPTKPQI